MANFEQAINWMKEGKKVTRVPGWSGEEGAYIYDGDDGITMFSPFSCDDTGRELEDKLATFGIHELDADDWEICYDEKEKEPMEVRVRIDKYNEVDWVVNGKDCYFEWDNQKYINSEEKDKLQIEFNNAVDELAEENKELRSQLKMDPNHIAGDYKGFTLPQYFDGVFSEDYAGEEKVTPREPIYYNDGWIIRFDKDNIPRVGHVDEDEDDE